MLHRRIAQIGIALFAGIAGTTTADVFLEDFNGTFPPTGWTVVNNGDANGAVWGLNTDFGDINDTGGDGTAAAIDSNASGFGDDDAELISPFLVVPEDAFLEFDHSFRWYFLTPDEQADVDIRVEAGDWTNLASYTGASDGYPGGAHKSIDLGAYAGQTVQIRFHYYNANWDYWWQIDNVHVIQMTSVPTVSNWGLIITALMLIVLGTVVLRARLAMATRQPAVPIR